MNEPGSSLRVRPATAADLVRVGQIWAANQDERPSLGSAGVPSLYDHELAARELVVAEHEGQVVGFAALLTRGRVCFLADLFVDPAHQSRGLGGHLLRQVLPRQGRPWCTLSSSDPRALSLYLRAGLRPSWCCEQNLVVMDAGSSAALIGDGFDDGRLMVSSRS